MMKMSENTPNAIENEWNADEKVHDVRTLAIAMLNCFERASIEMNAVFALEYDENSTHARHTHADYRRSVAAALNHNFIYFTNVLLRDESYWESERVRQRKWWNENCM